MVNGSRAKTGRGQTVKALFGRSKILTAVAALDTAPMGVTTLDWAALFNRIAFELTVKLS